MKFLSPHAKLPTKGSKLAARYDLNASKSVLTTLGSWKLVDTVIAITTKRKDSSLYTRIAPRSGLSVKGLDIQAGVIDVDYRSSVKVLLFNNSSNNFQINLRDRMAQLILERIENPD